MSQNTDGSPSKSLEQAETIIRHFVDFHGKPEKLFGGIINTTFRCGDVILQRLGPMFEETVITDSAYVLEYLGRQSPPFALPFPVRTRSSGHLFVVDEHGCYWRAARNIPNVDSGVDVCVKVASAAASLSWLHATLRGLDFTPQFQIPNFHNTPNIMAVLSEVVFEPGSSGGELQRQLLQLASRFYLPGSRLTQLIHGDPKLNNFLFDARGGVVGMIDWDTVMVESTLVDIGDGFRSWCRDANGRFDERIFVTAATAYHDAGHGDSPTQAQMRDAVRLIALELSARFLTDHARGETYFSLSEDAEENIALCLDNAFRYFTFFKSV